MIITTPYNYVMQISFDGSRYKGWQRQKSSETTIQGRVEQVLSRLLTKPTNIIGCSRTDAGVHALGYVANFHTTTRLIETDFLQDLNNYLPDDIVIFNLQAIDDRFHARHNSISKLYSYRIDRRPQANPFSLGTRLHFANSLHLETMEKVAQLLCGEHDFRCFTTQKPDERSLKRELFHIEILNQSDELQINILGDAFLWNMARILAAVILEGGMTEPGAREAYLDKVCYLLKAQSRELAASPLAVKGLFLQKVNYPNVFALCESPFLA